MGAAQRAAVVQCKLQIVLWMGGNGGILGKQLSSDTDLLHNKGHGGLSTSQVTSHSEIWQQGANGLTAKPHTVVCIDCDDTKPRDCLVQGASSETPSLISRCFSVIVP